MRSNKEKARSLLDKWIKKMVPNPSWTQQMGINWIYGEFDKKTELECYHLIKEAREDLDAP